ncbi:hypothetical protein JZ751_015561, partial [Albula glossodonta]
ETWLRNVAVPRLWSSCGSPSSPPPTHHNPVHRLRPVLAHSQAAESTRSYLVGESACGVARTGPDQLLGSSRPARAEAGGIFMNTGKQQKPVLTGQRFKTRKRGESHTSPAPLEPPAILQGFTGLKQPVTVQVEDEKEKFEPTVFRDTIVGGISEAGGDLDAVAKFLDVTGSRLDYPKVKLAVLVKQGERGACSCQSLEPHPALTRPAPPSLNGGNGIAMTTGGSAARRDPPGGTRIDDGDKTKVTEHCVFTAPENHAAIRSYAQVFNKLIRRYKYLEKAFEEEMKKLLLFLKAFSEAERTKLAMLTGILLANGTLPPSILTSLFSDNIVKEGISATFAVKMFKAWIAEKDANAQNVDHFSKYFNEAGLKELSEFLRLQQSLGTRKELQKELQERLSQECPIREIVVYVKEEMKRNSLQEHAVIGLLWTCLMNAVEWNKKEELVTEQALKHLKSLNLRVRKTSPGPSLCASCGLPVDR